MTIRNTNPSWWWRSHSGCRTMRHMRDKWPHFITRHAWTRRKITEIPRQGPTKGVHVRVRVHPVSDGGKHAGSVMMTISGMLKETQLCAGRNWYCCRGLRDRWAWEIQNKTRKDSQTQTCRALVEKRRRQRRDEWSTGSWMSEGGGLWGLDGGDDDPRIRR